jgi:hypothetical protein
LNRSTFSNVAHANEPFSISVISRKKRAWLNESNKRKI